MASSALDTAFARPAGGQAQASMFARGAAGDMTAGIEASLEARINRHWAAFARGSAAISQALRKPVYEAQAGLGARW